MEFQDGSHGSHYVFSNDTQFQKQPSQGGALPPCLVSNQLAEASLSWCPATEFQEGGHVSHLVFLHATNFETNLA